MANQDNAPISFEQLEAGLQYWGPRINRMHGALQGGRMSGLAATAGAKPNTTRSTGGPGGTAGTTRKRTARRRAGTGGTQANTGT